MKYNVEAFKLAIKAIEHDPKAWDQRQWIGKKDPLTGEIVSAELARRYRAAAGFLATPIEKCQTTFCLAGQVLFQAGIVDASGEFTDKDHSDTSVKDMAADILGLDHEEAGEIFLYGTSIDPLDSDSFLEPVATIGGLKERITKVTGITFED